jgi:Tfp pilus assembly protein PilW
MKQLNIRRKKNQRGVTLLEIGLGLVIALVLFGILFQVFTSTSQSQQADQAQKSLLALVTGAKSLAQGGRYTGLTTQVLIDSGKVPDGLADGNTINNPFGGQFQVAAANVAGGTNNAVAICVTNVGRSECNSLVNGSAGAFGRIGVGTGAITCSGTAGTSVKDRWAATPVVPTTGSVTTACNNDTNTIAFVTN